MANTMLLLALLGGALHRAGAQDAWDPEGQVCYAADLKIGEHVLNKQQIMDGTDELLTAAVTDLYNTDQAFKDFMDTRGTCQHTCVDQVVRNSMSSLYGRQGPSFIADSSKTLAMEALTGSFRACYPSPPRDQVVKLMEGIVNALDKGKAFPKDPATPQSVPCPNSDNLGMFHVDEFLADFQTAIQGVIATKPEIKEFFDTKAKDCQMECLDRNVPISAGTMFEAGIDDRTKAIDAFTGAIHSCFPGVPQPDILAVVRETAAVMDAAEKRLRLRLYNAKVPEGAMAGFRLFPLCGLAAAAGLLLFAAGVAVGRRARKPQIVREDDGTALIDSESLAVE